MSNNKNNEYRQNKKQNKAKIRSGQKQKDFSINEDSILNSLPTGAFDLNMKKNGSKYNSDMEDEQLVPLEKKIEGIHLDLSKNTKDDQPYIVKISNEESKNNDIDDKSDSEEFDDNYFESKEYNPVQKKISNVVGLNTGKVNTIKDTKSKNSQFKKK